MNNLLKSLIIVPAVVILFGLLASCAQQDEFEYDAVFSTILAVHNGFSLDITELTDTGFMNPKYYPYVREKLDTNAWTLTGKSGGLVDLKFKTSTTYCSDKTTMESMTMLGVASCTQEADKVFLTLKLRNSDV